MLAPTRRYKFDTKGVGETGTGHYQFNWWDDAFNRAADNIQVASSSDEDDSDDEKGVRLKVKDASVRTGLISTVAPKKAVKNSFYLGFVKPGTDDTVQGRKNKDFSKGVTDDDMKKAVGLTGHKGARHGLVASTKLERLAVADTLISERIAAGDDWATAARTAAAQMADQDDLNRAAKKSEKGKKKEKKEKKEKKAKKSKSSTKTNGVDGEGSETILSTADDEKEEKKKKKKKKKAAAAEAAAAAEEATEEAKKLKSKRKRKGDEDSGSAKKKKKKKDKKEKKK